MAVGWVGTTPQLGGWSCNYCEADMLTTDTVAVRAAHVCMRVCVCACASERYHCFIADHVKESYVVVIAMRSFRHCHPIND